VVLLLHYQQDLSIEETAVVLDIPVGTAKSRLAYGVSVLRKLLDQKGHDDTHQHRPEGAGLPQTGALRSYASTTLGPGREVVATGAAIAAAIWFASRPPSPQLGVEATIIIVLGAMIAAVTAKLRSLIQHNTRLVLQALAGLRPPPD